MSLLGIDETLQTLLACVCEALESSGAPACICSTTVGVPVILNPCACKGGAGSGEVWGALQQVYRIDRQTLQQTAPGRRPCGTGKWGARFQITLARCFPTIDARGNPPKPEAQAAAAAQLHADTAAIHRALSCCALDDVLVETIGVQADPQGGASFLIATVVAGVSLAARDNHPSVG